MRRITICVLASILFVLLPFLSEGSQTKGIKVIIKDASGRKVGLYKESHALVIGVSDYTAGWPKLETVPDEIDQVETALKSQGFHVVKVMNPTSDQLSEAFEDFIDKYGFDENNRLLFFFSGHGHSRKGGRKGYLVPTDAPDPRYDENEFLRKAIGMNRVITWAREMEAKHALFLFDSCFSGTVFKARALPSIPPHISDFTSRPVRQFISAGSAGEEVPARSVFTPSFIRALRGEGDLDRDGYVTGTELGMYLHKKVLSYRTGQTPQYGKIKDPDLDEGDFVFLLASSDTTIKKPSIHETRKSVPIIPQSTLDKEMLFWQSIRDSDDPALFEAYLKTFRNGVFTPIARRKIETLKQKKVITSIPPEVLKSKLFVEVEPRNAKVRILNIKPLFHQGMELALGRYHVEVSSDGYETKDMWVKLEAGKDETLRFSLEQKPVPRVEASIRQTSKHLNRTTPVSEKSIVGREGVYIAFANGIVRDTNAGLEWKVEPDRDMTWDEARSWVQRLNLDGGGWRMPTMDELESLYKAGEGNFNMTSLLKTTGWWGWSGETKGSSDAWYFYFPNGERSWYTRDYSKGVRAFAVRSRRVQKEVAAKRELGEELNRVKSKMQEPTQTIRKLKNAQPKETRMGFMPKKRTSDVPSPVSVVPKNGEIARGGRFIAYANGTVLDTKTNLMWAARDSRDTLLEHQAKDYIKNYRTGGYTDWRMPTMKELEMLYDRDMENEYGYHVTRLIGVTDEWVWGSKERGDMWAFDFNRGYEADAYGIGHDDRIGTVGIGIAQALPVRAGN